MVGYSYYESIEKNQNIEQLAFFNNTNISSSEEKKLLRAPQINCLLQCSDVTQYFNTKKSKTINFDFSEINFKIDVKSEHPQSNNHQKNYILNHLKEMSNSFQQEEEIPEI